MAWELAQLNVAEWAVDPDGPVAVSFHQQLDEVEARAEAAPGWRWRLPDDAAADGEALFGDGWLVNLTVWEDVRALHAFAYRDARHAQVLRDRRRWFVQQTQPTSVLWWVPAGHRPTVEEAAARLDHLREHGPSSTAFTFRDRFDPPDA